MIRHFIGSMRALLGPVLGDYPRLKIRGKRAIHWAVPPAVGILFGVGALFLDAAPLVADGGLVQQIGGLLSILVAFYVGGLGVFVALPEGGKIDRVPSVLKAQRIGQTKDQPQRRGRPATQGKPGHEVTVRRLLMAMFTYLALVSLALHLVGVVASVFGPPFVTAVCPDSAKWVRLGFAAFYGFYFGRIAGHTIYAIWLMGHYLPNMGADPPKDP